MTHVLRRAVADRVVLWLCALTVVGGCSFASPESRLESAAHAARGAYLPIDPADFPGGTVALGKPTTEGSQLLIDAVQVNASVAGFVAANGIPDAIAVDIPHRYAIWLAYVARDRLYIFYGEKAPLDRPLEEAELDQIVPERRVARRVEELQHLVGTQDRIARIARRMALTLPAVEDQPAGEYYGFTLLRITPLTAFAYGVSPDAPGDLIASVNPDGPAAAALIPGDVLVAVNGVLLSTRESEDMRLEGPVKLTVLRGGETETFEITPEEWPREIEIIAVRDETPNAGAVDNTVAVTTGMSDMFASDDVMAVVIGHEMAHVTLGHVERKVTPGSLLKGVINVGVLLPMSIALPGSDQLLGGLMTGIENRFNRDQEREADRVGLHYAKAGGYDPKAALVLMDTLSERMPVPGVVQFMDIHPPYAERRELLATEIGVLQP